VLLLTSVTAVLYDTVMSETVKRLTIRLPEGVHQRLRRYAALKGSSVQRLVVDIIAGELEAHERQAAQQVYEAVLHTTRKAKPKGGKAP